MNEKNFENEDTQDFKNITQKADKGIMWNTLSIGVTFFVQILKTIILARILAPDEFGMMSLILVVIGFGTLFSDFGISSALVHFQNVPKKQLSTLFWFSFIVGFVMFIFFFLLSPIISTFFQEPELNALIRVTSIVFLISPLGQQSGTLIRKELDFKSFAIVEILGTTINFVVSIILALNNVGTMSLVIGFIFGTLTKSLLFFIIGFRIWKPSVEFYFSDIKYLLSFGIYQFSESLVDFFKNNIDKLIIGKFFGATDLGYYNIAYSLILYPVHFINSIFIRVSSPYFAKFQRNKELLKKKYLELIGTVSFITSPIYLLFIVISPLLVPFLYGTQWYPSIILSQILSLVGLLNTINNPISSLIIAQGRVKLGFVWKVLLLIVQPFVIISGIYVNEIVGVTQMLVIFNFLFSIVAYFLLIKKMIGSCAKDYIKSFFSSFLFGIISSLLSYLACLFIVFNSAIIQIAIQVIIGISVYILCHWIFNRKKLFELIRRPLEK